MLPFRFGVYAAVASTMSAWRDRARVAEGLGYSTLYVSDRLGAQFERFPACRGGDRLAARYRERRSGSGVTVRW
jgi:hypothetical protein